MPDGLGVTELMFVAGAAVVGFGAVKFMMMASADKKREQAREAERRAAEAAGRPPAPPPSPGPPG